MQKEDNAENGRGVSNSALPRHESPIIKALSGVHNGITFPEGEIWVVPSENSIDKLAKAITSNDISVLSNNIRLCCQYKATSGGRIIHLASDEREQMKHYLVEETLNILSRSYPTLENYQKYGDAPALRKNGMPVIVHPLQAGVWSAAIEAPLHENDRLSFMSVIITLLHDLPEDVEDDKPSMKDVKFRAMRNNFEIELADRKKILDYLVGLYSEYNEYVARGLPKRLLLLTRKDTHLGMTKEEYYVSQYLRGVYRDVQCAKAKAADFLSNSMAIRNKGNELEMLRLAKSLIYKGLPQVLAWKKDAWVEYHCLLARLEDILSLFRNEPEYRGIIDEIKAPSAADLENFAAGYVITGSRKFNYNLMATMPPSGSPVLTIYKTVRSGKKTIEVEIPLCRNVDQARDIVQSGFPGVLEESIMQAPNIIQKRLGSGFVVSFEAKESVWDNDSKLRSSSRKCTRTYDRRLHEGAMCPALTGFNRNRSYEQAEKKYKPIINAGSQRLERFKFYKVQVR